MEPIDPRIEEYAVRMSTPHEELLAELSEQTTREVGMEQMLTGPLAVSIAAVGRHSQVSGSPGAIPRGRLEALSAYLRAHEGSARFEAAA